MKFLVVTPLSIYQAAPSSLEVMRKTLRREKAETTEENEAVTGDREGTAGDLPDYVPTGEDRRI